MKKIKKSDLPKWLERIAKNYELIAPVKEDVIQFKPVGTDYNLSLHFTNSVVPPKHFFLPQTENLFTWYQDGGKIELKETQEFKGERVILGIRPCDVKSLLLLDFPFSGVFIDKDSHYLERRAKTILIGLACTQSADTCFCSSFGIDPFSAEGTDIFLIDRDEYYLVVVSTDKGKHLVNLSPVLFSDIVGTPPEAGPHTEIQTRIILIDKAYECIESQWDDEIWLDISQKCIECGICTYLCPTCYCFDIQDEMNAGAPRQPRGNVPLHITAKEGVRFRCWDSCMFSEFTLMASGENPRKTKRDRIRNRFFHKFKYFKDKYGIFGCVGCSRCITKCPVNIDITRVLQQLGNCA